MPILQSDQQATAALTAQQGVRITQAETSIDLIGQEITTINLALGDKANVSTVNPLSNTVSQQGNSITVQGTAINDIQAVLNGFSGANAVANAFSA